MLLKKDVDNGNCSREDYYSQFCTDDLEKWVANKFHLGILIQAYLENEDFINSPFIPLSKWISLSEKLDKVFPCLEAACKNVGDNYTVAFKVQVLKQTAKILVEKSI